MIPYARLTIDLAAIAANWQILADTVSPAECAAAVKANAYGLGIAEVAPALWQAGCRSYFVAQLEEGLQLRSLLPLAHIYLLNGLPEKGEAEAHNAGLIPDIHGLPGLARMQELHASRPPRICLQIDTGINRLGFEENEIVQLRNNRSLLAGLDIALILSHFVTSENPQHLLNKRQRERFCKALESLPAARTSLANSSGIFLGPAYHFDMVRPGAALYGINPTQDKPNPMHNTVLLEAQILQIHEVKAGETVGYGGNYMVERPTRIATASIGYADGVNRALSNRGAVYAGGKHLPIVGRVSMDLITIDISTLQQEQLHEGDFVEVIGPHRPLDVVAKEAETIGYEVLTGLGQRPVRCYKAFYSDDSLAEGAEICHI